MTLDQQQRLDLEFVKETRSLDRGLRELCRYALQGGRRVRAGLLLAAAREAEQEALGAAVALEMLHAATLLQDDIFDEGRLRRGRTAAHIQFGKAQTILASDWLLLSSLEIAGRTGPAYFRSVLCAAKAMTEAEARELNPSVPASVEAAQLMGESIARGKTGRLFGAALCGAASVLKLSAKDCSLWESFGTEIGVTYQLLDDCLDCYGQESSLGKTLGHDLDAGCFTLPLLLAAVALQRQGTGPAFTSLSQRSLTEKERHSLALSMHSEGVRRELCTLVQARLCRHCADLERMDLRNEATVEWLSTMQSRAAECFQSTREF